MMNNNQAMMANSMSNPMTNNSNSNSGALSSGMPVQLNQVTMYQPHDQTLATTTIFSNNALSIPGYLKLNANTDFTMEGQVGKGATAQVYKARVINPLLISKHGVTEAAVKLMPKVDQNSFNFEIALMGSIPASPYIVLFLGYIDDPFGIIMKMYACSLKDILFNEAIDVTQENKKQFVSDVAKGINHLHTFGIVHFDIKPLNILLEMINENETRCVISDFGVSKHFNKNSK